MTGGDTHHYTIRDNFKEESDSAGARSQDLVRVRHTLFQLSYRIIKYKSSHTGSRTRGSAVKALDVTVTPYGIKEIALAGNRTRVPRLEGVDAATIPLMLFSSNFNLDIAYS